MKPDVTGAGAPARGVRPAPAPAGAARRAGARLASFLRFLPALTAAARRCLSPRASSSRRRGLPAAPRAGAGIALLLLAALTVIGALPSPAAAQNVLVSNMGDRSGSGRNEIFAQPFTTGDHAQGYILSSVGIRTNTTAGDIDTFRVRILSDSSGNPGSTVIATLTGPAAGIRNVVTVFTAPSDTTLAANTTYYVEAGQTDGTGGFNHVTTSSNAEDSGASSGWSIGNGRYRRDSESDSWGSSTSSVRLRINGFAVNSAGDYTPPALRTSLPVQVAISGSTVGIVFTEGLDHSNRPPLDAFTVEAGGSAVTITGYDRFFSILSSVTLNLSPAIRQGQTVEVSYTDPTPGDDADAIQDAVGNDAAGFTRTALNNSTQAAVAPDPPTGLTATADGDEEVDLSWTRPADNGGRTISGYRIEWRAVDGTTWQDAVADTGSADTTHSVTVPSGETNRRFRVSAKNSVGTGNPSNVATAVNTPATGAPAVTGPGRAGQMLTAATGGISDVDGLTGATYAYRWFHLEGTTETAISGATGNSYMPVAADVGRRIGVRVDFTDDRGFAETLASAAVAIRAAMPPAACPAFSVPAGRESIWTGTVTVGASPIQVEGHPVSYGFSGISGSLTDPKHFDLGTTRYTVDVATVNRAAPQGQLLFSLDRALTAGQVRSLRLHVCGETYAFADATHASSLDHYSWPTAGLDWSGLVGSTRVLHLTALPNRPATGLPAVTGTARVGSTVTASTASIRDADGLTGVTYEYRWLRVDGGSETEISGATGRTYELTADDAGKRVGVRVSFSDDALNEEALTSAAFPRTGTIAMPVPAMTDPSDLLSATLTVKDVASLFLGCSGGTSASFVSCKNTDVLTARGFTVPGTSTTRNIDQIQLSTGGGLVVVFDGSFTDAQKARLAMDFDGTQLTFSDATVGNNNDASWTSTGLSWSGDDTVAVKVKDRGTGDVTPPELASAEVDEDGNGITLVFDESLKSDLASIPLIGAFTVTADGRPIEATFDGAAEREYYLSLSPVIQQGQIVTVSYTDPAPGDDEHALQDAAGNDVATFENVAVTNRSTVTGVPGAPTGLTATKAAGANRGTQIDLAWDEPSDTGLSQISGYRIEWSADGNAPWADLVPDTGSTDRTHSDSGLPSPTTRHYRVSAINGQGTGSPSGTADATTDDTVGPVLVSARISESGLSVILGFNESADPDRPPPASAFTVSAGGVPVEFGNPERFVEFGSVLASIRLPNLSPTIKQGQTVVVTYEDPTAGNDAQAIQDTSGNDAASFTTGVGDVPAVVNNSNVTPVAPGKVPNLAAAPGGDTSIVLTWDRPADNGGRVIGSYRIEVSEDVDPLVWQELEATHDTMKDGAIERRYEHPGLDPATTRHYRVRAKNAVGDGDWSDEDGATTTSGAPDAPTGLTATPGLPSPRDGTTLIRLGWDAPTLAQEGDSRITGYRIEVSEDVDPLVWKALEDDTGNRNRVYRHTGLPSEVTRHYRVFAINDDGTSLASAVKQAKTPDILGPVPQSARVSEEGDSIEIVFNEMLDGTAANLPAAGRFTVRAGDGARFRIGGVAVSGTDATLSLHADSPVIRTGQALTVVYTDRTASDDAAGVVQDDDGNDAAAFTLGPDQTVTVTNGSTEPATAPGKPQNVEAESGGDDRIVLTWDAPADTGGRTIAGYRVEVSTDGNPPWAELAASHDTMNNGKFEYTHTGLGTGDVRHYRVSARNAIGLGSASDTEMGVVEMKGRVVLSAAAASVAEGGSVAWTVTATTDEDARPESGLAMQVTVVSEDGTAAAPGDYAALEAAAGTVTFRRPDFGRRNVQGVGYRWVAVKRGPVAVAIVDDVEVEAEENFALTMSIGSGGTGWVRGTDRVEVAIPDTDEWGIAVVAEPAEIAEGETREVALTAHIVLGDGTVPAEDACVARFPVSVRLETGGTATAGTDYTLDGALDEQTIAACGAEASWRVTLTAAVDRVDDPGETVAFAPELAAVPETAPALLAPAAVTVRESRGVVLSAFALDVEEGGEESYTAVLTSRPTGTVRLTRRVSGDPDVTVEPARLTFTRDNWNQPQTLTVRADQDPDDEDDAATISHGVTGADYGANGVTAGEVRVAVLDDDKTFGVMTVRLSDGADGAGTHDPAPAEHHGEAFHITLWWSETRTHDYEGPRKAIGADRAIRVTGAAVVPVRDEHTGSWTQSRLRLKLTPDGTDDVTLVLEPMDCSFPDWRQPRPDPYALCAWRRDGLGITGLAERVRWTVHGIGAAPAAPGNLTLGTDEILTVQADVVDSRTVLVAGFDADPDASHWRVEAQAPGGDWSGARVWRAAKHGSRHNVRLDGLAPDGAWAVRARWENRYGAGPWAEVRTTDGVAPPAPRGLAAAPGPDGRSVRLTWRPASAASAARYQYRLGRLAQTLAGGWLDIPDSGPGAANRTSFTVHGVERVWEIKAQLRAVSASGRAGPASAEARVPAARPRVLQDGVALTSDPGEDGRYAIGDRIEVAVTMSRPVRHEGAVPPTVRLAFDDGRTHEAALVRIRQPGTAGIGDSGYGSGDTLVFAYTVRQDDEDMDGIAIPANGLRAQRRAPARREPRRPRRRGGGRARPGAALPGAPGAGGAAGGHGHRAARQQGVGALRARPPAVDARSGPADRRARGAVPPGLRDVEAGLACGDRRPDRARARLVAELRADGDRLPDGPADARQGPTRCVGIAAWGPRGARVGRDGRDLLRAEPAPCEVPAARRGGQRGAGVRPDGGGASRAGQRPGARGGRRRGPGRRGPGPVHGAAGAGGDVGGEGGVHDRRHAGDGAGARRACDRGRRLRGEVGHAGVRAGRDGEDDRGDGPRGHAAGQRRGLPAVAGQPVGRGARRRRGDGDDPERRAADGGLRVAAAEP